jgi:two-component system nitrogen regulation response regulator GlnG
VRVIAATHQDLQDRVARGIFREDLFHRLNVIRIELPPLRARREDVADLLAHYLRVAAQELGVEAKTLAADAIAVLEAYSWPGNVRELVNLCRRLTVLAPGSEIHAEDLPAEVVGTQAKVDGDAWSDKLARWAESESRKPDAKPLLDTAVPEFERTLIRIALKHTAGHRQDAAKLLGWGRNTLTRKLKELGMSDAEASDAEDALPAG